MAQQFYGTIDLGFVDSRRATPAAYSGIDADASLLSVYANTQSIRSIRTALNTFDPKTYPTSMLDTMNTNDLVFAWRMCTANAKSVSDYAVTQSVRP